MVYLRRICCAAILTGFFLLDGCRDGPSAPESTQRVYYDLVTEEPIVVSSDTAAESIDKGRLREALYCPRCQRWHPGPSPEQFQRQQGKAYCPETGELLRPTGPLPGSRGEAPPPDSD